MINYLKIKYLIKHLLIIIHLLFKTKKFGINNKFYNAQSSSIFGVNLWKKFINILLVYPIYINYKHMKWRMGANVGFVTKKEYFLIYGKDNKSTNKFN